MAIWVPSGSRTMRSGCAPRRMRTADRLVLRLWLRAPVVDTDEGGTSSARRPGQGTPLGGVISPLLANLYLHWFDKRFHERGGPADFAKARLVRYADDCAPGDV